MKKFKILFWCGLIPFVLNYFYTIIAVTSNNGFQLFDFEKITGLKAYIESFWIYCVFMFPFFILGIAISLISFIKLKRSKEKLFKNKRNIIILLIVFFILSVISFYGSKIITKKVIEQDIDKTSNVIINHLNSRYGNCNFKIVSYEAIYNYNYCYYISSSETENYFNVNANIVTQEIYSETFLKEYYLSEQDNVNIEDYIKEQAILNENNHIPDILEVNVQFENVEINNNLYNDDFGKIPTIEELIQYANVLRPTFVVSKKFTTDNKDEFIDYMLKIYSLYEDYYKQYNKYSDDDYRKEVYDSIDTNMVRFYLTYENPFANGNGNYMNGGYLKVNDNICEIHCGQDIKAEYIMH